MSLTRRQFLGRGGTGIGVAALGSLLNQELLLAGEPRGQRVGGLPSLPHHRPTAKRVIFLFQSGAPSQLDLFDPKPELRKRQGEELPESIRQGQRLTGMTADQASKPLAASAFRFARHGACGAEVSELLPHTSRVVDDLCIVRSAFTDAINHDPGVTFFQTGSERPGRPSIGAWASYGLGAESANLPAFIVFLSGGNPGDQPLFDRLWGSGFLPSQHQGVKFRGQGDPVLYLSNPPGVRRATRRRMLDAIATLNRLQHDTFHDPETLARIQQYELTFQIQRSLPEVMDLSDEPASTFALYGDDARRPGTYASNCLIARRLAERGVRFIQLFHRGWDHHASLPSRIRGKCRETDQGSAALVRDLKQRGLLDDTLVVWAGEFGRTVYCQGDLTDDNYGRDHHPRCFSMWMAGGGVRGGQTIGKTDAFSYNIDEDPIHVHDLQATILHCLGIDHRRLTYRSQGRDFRLTDVHGRVVYKLLA